MKRIFTVCLTLILCASCLPVYAVFAEETVGEEEAVIGIQEELEEEDWEQVWAEMVNEVQEEVQEEVPEELQEEIQDELEEGSEQNTQSHELSIESPSAILMEASTGQVVYEKNADERRSPASVTKVMTLLLIYEALEKGNLQMTDEVTTSAYAKSMGGSQVFLEEGEKQSVETMIKCIVIASGNDAAVAMAEHVAGSEQEFVSQMNSKAKELGMENTNFEDCCGLTESENHYTTARDIAIMSRELITKYPQISEFATIWMEDITHVTDKGSSEFTLTNTNKLLRSYEGITGLKTGSTSIAKYCLSATAKRNGIELISAIMAAPDPKVRFNDAATLLTYGFGKCNLYTDENEVSLDTVKVKKGLAEQVGCQYEGEFNYLDTDGNTLEGIEKEIVLPETVEAPVEKGQIAGKAVYYLDGEEIGSVDILYTDTIEKAGFKDYLIRAVKELGI